MCSPVDVTKKWVEREVSGGSYLEALEVWSLTPIPSCSCAGSVDGGVTIGGPSSDAMSEVVTPSYSESQCSQWPTQSAREVTE